MNSKFARYGVPLILPLIIIIAWGWSTRNNDALFFPSMVEIFRRIFEIAFVERLHSDLIPSLVRLLAGWAMASVIGLVVGVILSSGRLLREIANPLIDFFRSIPAAALVPFALLVFGIGDDGKLFVITIVCLWPVLINTMDAVEEIDPMQRQTVKAFRISRGRELAGLLIPSAAPRIATGMRTSLALAIIVMLITEMVASTNGIGFFTIQAQRTFQITDMWAGIVMLGILGFLLNFLFVFLEKRILSWYFESKHTY